MPAFFVTGTGTEIGKTFVCAGLIRHLRAALRPVRALKPVISGFDAATAPASDSALLLDALGIPLCDDAIAAISPWRYAAPLSPNMAARAEARSIDLDEVVTFCRQEISAAADATVLIEGVGGLMVPLDERRTVLDWIARLNVPILLIAGSYLGAISHTLTCVEVLRSRGLPLAAILVNESAGGVALQPTVETIRAFAGPSAVIALPRAAGDAERNAVYAQVLSLVR
jgi:dethiobiotin synthetase